VSNRECNANGSTAQEGNQQQWNRITKAMVMMSHWLTNIVSTSCRGRLTWLTHHTASSESVFTVAVLQLHAAQYHSRKRAEFLVHSNFCLL